MKKTIQMSIGIILSFLVLGCSQAEEGDLSISLTGSSAYLFDSTAQSCTNKVAVFVSPSTATPSSDISSYYFSFHGATLSWKNTTESVYIQQMKVEFEDGNMNQSCTISGDELLSIFYDFTSGGTGTAWTGSLSPATTAAAPTTRTSQCKIRCGGFTVANPKRSFTSVGTLTVIGIQVNATSGEEKPVRARTSVKLIYE